MTPTASPAKFTARPAVLPANARVNGLSSWPPLRRLFRVTTKSAVQNAALVANKMLFSRSQNRWLGASGSVTGSEDFTRGAGSIDFGDGNSEKETCCATAGPQVPKNTSRTAAFGFRIAPIQVVGMTLVRAFLGHWY